ncbi:FKBP-type peptidyl-prolyl cis-trans isomerase [Massilia arenosa]|uniref:Peptidyl-prolyl cis-trans isomerase n=1 Tax=Zemynaea arenosa TaxID=2561931 RepID=A0A4Y9SRH8_9BURK|nr:FKBP-type peptidyl-prolyl cis-trans isomerase [Massilia arenosa]TFW29402.1 FKBP-type peptidyl-prolyl cis-trans isomerase [Massilia arenosa]
MNFKPFLAAAFVAALSLAGCGGGGGDSGGSSNPSLIYSGNPTALKTTDITVGTGAEAVNGKTVEVKYTGWLYNDKATDLKGTQFDTGTIAGANAFVVGNNSLIKGFDQGLVGMKVGGKRTILIPSSLGYGAAGRAPSIPGNAGLVFEVELTSVK